jgi:hypothetical protein
LTFKLKSIQKQIKVTNKKNYANTGGGYRIMTKMLKEHPYNTKATGPELQQNYLDVTM